MIILDTNVVSDVMKSDPDHAVIAWLDQQPSQSVWTSVVTIYEIEFGLKRLATGKRREALEQFFHEAISQDLGGRILPLSYEAAVAAGAIGAELQALGKPVDVRDVLIAGIARSHRACVATRNVSDFANACDVINPWQDT